MRARNPDDSACPQDGARNALQWAAPGAAPFSHNIVRFRVPVKELYTMQVAAGGCIPDAEVPMASERAFTCGNSKYYVVEYYSTFIVQRQDWFGRAFVTYARDLAEAIARIEADAHCWQIRAA